MCLVGVLFGVRELAAALQRAIPPAVSFPLVDQNSAAESEIGDKPGGLDVSAGDHHLNGFWNW